MILIVCLDDKNGMMFNKRRQSKDSAVCADIMAEVGDGVLWMNEYSAKQFAEDEAAGADGCRAGASNIVVDEEFLSKAASGEYCFLEGAGAAEASDSVEKLIIYKWNRLYPSDVRFDMPLDGWKLESTAEFAGSSHEKIAKEVYIK